MLQVRVAKEDIRFLKVYAASSGTTITGLIGSYIDKLRKEQARSVLPEGGLL